MITPIFLFFILKKLPPKISFLILILFMIVTPILFRIIYFNPQITPEKFDLFTRKVVLNRLDSISFGLLSSWVFCYYNEIWNKYRFHFLIIGLLLILFVKFYNPSIGSIYKQLIFISLSPISAMLILPFFYYLDFLDDSLSFSLVLITIVS